MSINLHFDLLDRLPMLVEHYWNFFVCSSKIHFAMESLYPYSIGIRALGRKKYVMITSSLPSEWSHQLEDIFYRRHQSRKIIRRTTVFREDLLFSFPLVLTILTVLGSIYIWDFLFRQDQPTLTVKVIQSISKIVHLSSIQ